MSKLSKDILYFIFEKLQGDSKSLFSCLLVNRLWCEAVVPIIWKDPWCSTNGDCKNIQNKSSLNYIFTLFLSENGKEFLTSEIQLSQFSRRPLLFDYLSFCLCINASAINEMSFIYSSSASDRFHIQQEIYGLLMRKCPKLKYLDMRSLQHQIYLFPGATNFLESLCELNCDTSMDSVYFYGIARICQSIQSLIIFNTSIKDNDGLVSLIEAQRNLKYFEWDDKLNVVYSNDLDDFYCKIARALKKKADTLMSFINRFNNVDDFVNIVSQVLPDLDNLKVLKLNIMTNVLERYLRISTFQHLEVFQINYINIKAINYMIGGTGGRLKQIFIKDLLIFSYDLYDESLKLIRIVRETCPLIENLSLVFIQPSDKHLIELEKLLRTCQNLKVLILEMDDNSNDKDQGTYEERKLASGEKLLNVLVRSAPSNLSVIGILNEFKFSINTLGEFLENWKGRPVLSFFTSSNECINEEFTKLIDKYKDNVLIKEFRHSNVDSIMDNYGL